MHLDLSPEDVVVLQAALAMYKKSLRDGMSRNAKTGIASASTIPTRKVHVIEELEEKLLLPKTKAQKVEQKKHIKRKRKK